MFKMLFFAAILVPAAAAGGPLIWSGHPWWGALAAVVCGTIGGFVWLAVMLHACRVTG